MKLFDATLTRLERSLDVRLARHNVLASNLANVDTPGYTPKDVDFAAAMAAAGGGASSGPAAPTLAATEGVHFDGNGVALTGPSPATAGAAPIVDATSEAPGIDGNKVDLDRTMAALAENALQYGAGARAAGKKLAMLRYVVSDGNG